MPRQKPSERESKAHRILDAALELTLRWGYDKTTMDNIAEKAGIAKGTLYLYWNTREDLFRALVKRERLRWAEDFAARVAMDPEAVTPRGIYAQSALSLAKQPLLKALLLRDMNVLGKLAQAEDSLEAMLQTLGSFEGYLQALRDLGLVRTDIPLRSQVYTASAILMGFFLIEPIAPAAMTPSDEDKARLVGEAVHRTLTSEKTASADELQALHTAFRQYLNRELDNARERFQKELEKDHL